MRATSSLWPSLRAQAHEQGLTLLWRVPRAQIDPRFTDAGATDPAAWHPDYRYSVVLGSAGPALWRRVRAEAHAVPDPQDDPLDRFTERVVEALCAPLRTADPQATAVYPFRHARQVLGFQRLLGDAGPWLKRAPFGVLVHPQAGPWWALRAALLTSLEPPPWPEPGAPATSPCEACPAPCVAACPAQAVAKSGFDWRSCAAFRLREPTCRETCLARLACPIAPELRYDGEAIAFHYRASLRELERHRG